MSFLIGISGLLAFISVCLGLVFYVFFPNASLLIYGTWAVAGALSAGWFFLERKKVWRFFTQKSTRYGANLLLVVFLVVGILTFVNILARDFSYRKDITKLRSNTLSEQSVKILKDLQQPVRMVFLAPDEQKDAVEPMFRRYTYESKNISYEILNPNRYPTRVRAMGIEKIENGLLVLFLGDKKVVVQGGTTEEKITNGLVRLLKTKNQTVGFLTGHGERATDAPEGSPDSIGMLKAELEKEAYATKALNILATGKIPEDISVLLILGPRTAFFPKEIEILKDWINKGGKIVVALDLDPHASGLTVGARQIADLLKDYHVNIGTQLLVDPTSRAANVEPQILMAMAGSKEHPITKDFPSSSVGLAANFLFPLTARLTKLEPLPDGMTITSLAKTTPNAWVASDWAAINKGSVSFNPAKDFKGEMDLAYAIDKKNGPRLVVFGTSSLTVDSIFNFSGNRDLFMNSISWLSDNAEFISIRPKDEANNDHLEIDANLLGIIRLLVIFVLPITTMAIGVWVWYGRRSK